MKYLNLKYLNGFNKYGNNDYHNDYPRLYTLKL